MISHCRVGSDCLFAMLPRFILQSLMIPLARSMLLPTHRQGLSTTSPVDASSNHPPDSSSLNPSELTLLNTSSVKESDDCFHTSMDLHLKPAQTNDCLRAALLLFERSSLSEPITFKRSLTGGFFPLPQLFHSGTCAIAVDVVHDGDEDKFPLWLVHMAALDLSAKCVGESSHLGGKMFVGPLKVVYVMVFGRNPPPVPTSGELVQEPPTSAYNVTL